jgi:hypothetical protein
MLARYCKPVHDPALRRFGRYGVYAADVLAGRQPFRLTSRQMVAGLRPSSSAV